MTVILSAIVWKLKKKAFSWLVVNSDSEEEESTQNVIPVEIISDNENEVIFTFLFKFY